MKIYGIGTDIVNIGRIDRIYREYDHRLVGRILGAEETSIFCSQKQKETYLAKRFAAKEAAAKALGTGVALGVRFKEISILNDAGGKPYIKFSGKTKEFADNVGIVESFVTISDDKDYAVAQVILLC